MVSNFGGSIVGDHCCECNQVGRNHSGIVQTVLAYKESHHILGCHVWLCCASGCVFVGNIASAAMTEECPMSWRLCNKKSNEFVTIRGFAWQRESWRATVRRGPSAASSSPSNGVGCERRRSDGAELLRSGGRGRCCRADRRMWRFSSCAVLPSICGRSGKMGIFMEAPRGPESDRGWIGLADPLWCRPVHEMGWCVKYVTR